MNKQIEMVPSNRGGYSECIDILKGLGIVLMVLGHAGFPFTYFIYLFHMAIFFMASGYCWKDANADSIGSCGRYVIRKIKTLYIPFVVCNLSFLLCTDLFINLRIYTDNERLLSLVPETYSYGMTDHMTVSSILKGITKTIAFSPSSQMSGATWFLQTLFIVSVVHCLVVFVIKKIARNRYTFILIEILACCCVAYELVNIGLINFIPTPVTRCIMAYIAYLIGLLFSRYYAIDRLTGNKAMFGCSFVILLILNNFGTVNMDKASAPTIIFFVLASVAGWCLLLGISGQMRKGQLGNVFAWIGKRTMPIIFLHFLSFKIVTAVYLLFTNGDMLLLAYFPAIGTESYLWIFYTIVGVAIPLMIYEMYSRVKTNFVRG